MIKVQLVIAIGSRHEYQITVENPMDRGSIYVDGIPKTIENCNLKPGTEVTIMYGHGLPWAKIVTPGE